MVMIDVVSRKGPNVSRSVWFTGSFEGFHEWGAAPADVDFLRRRHRHVFHWSAEVPVGHGDRDVEFIAGRREVEGYIAERWPDGELGEMSCEMVAEEIGVHLLALYGSSWARVSVSEDNENGGRVLVTPPTHWPDEHLVDDHALLVNIFDGDEA